MTKLSIIVPVYNVERYIRPCVESIFRQGLDDADFEVIIVNDGTPDKSMEMIADIIQTHNNITVINQENQGLSVARNNGIAAAKGEYILMPDSDDLLIENSLKPLLDKALETKADLVVADFLIMNDDEINNKQPIYQPELSVEKKTGEKLYIDDLKPNQYYVWRTLYRKDFIIKNNLKFIPGIYFQDVPFTHEAYLKAQTCIKTDWLLNIYRRGHESASNVAAFNMKKANDCCIAIAKSWELYKSLKGLLPETKKRQKYAIYISYNNFLYRILFHLDKISDKVKALKYLHQLVPDIEFEYSMMQKLGNILYKVSPFLFVIIQKCMWTRH